MSAGGVAPIRTAADFHRAVTSKSTRSSNDQTLLLHCEVLVRRVPFAQIFYLRREVEGQPLGIVLAAGTAEVREILPGSPAALHGMSARARAALVDSSNAGAGGGGAGNVGGPQTPPVLVPWVLTEINGRPLSLFAKESEAGERLGAVGRDFSVLVQPADFVQKLKKQLKGVRGYKDYVMT